MSASAYIRSAKAALGLLLATASSVGMADPRFCRTVQHMELHGHRGAADRPQNTLASFLRAAELGADFVELDVQINKESVPVVAHDTFVLPECSGGKKMYYRDLTTDQVRQLKCGPTAEPVPLLEDVFRDLRDVKTKRGELMRINVELKYNPAEQPEHMTRELYADLVLRVIKNSTYPLSRYMIQSFDLELLSEVRKNPLGKSVRLAPLYGAGGAGQLQAALKLHASLVTVHSAMVTVAMLKEYQSAGLRVVPWTVNDQAEAVRLANLGVDGIITDHPELIEREREACASLTLK